MNKNHQVEIMLTGVLTMQMEVAIWASGAVIKVGTGGNAMMKMNPSGEQVLVAGADT